MIHSREIDKSRSTSAVSLVGALQTNNNMHYNRWRGDRTHESGRTAILHDGILLFSVRRPTSLTQNNNLIYDFKASSIMIRTMKV